MPRVFPIWAVLTALLTPLRALAAEQAQRVFAAPAEAAHVPAGSPAGLGQVTLSLLLVLAAVFAVAWMMRRLRSVGAASGAAIEVVSQVALGARERAVIVRVGQQHLLLGVAPGRVNLLQQLPEGTVTVPASDPAAPKADFAALLRRSLGR